MLLSSPHPHPPRHRDHEHPQREPPVEVLTSHLQNMEKVRTPPPGKDGTWPTGRASCWRVRRCERSGATHVGVQSLASWDLPPKATWPQVSEGAVAA